MSAIEYTPHTALYVFGQNQYLKDQFKEIDYLVAPTGGLGYKMFDTAATKLDVDGGVGVVWEKNPGFDVDSSGAIATGEKLVQTLTSNTTLTQTFMGLWKMEDFEDALFTLGVSLAVAMSTHTQLKVEALDTYKNKPPLPTIQQNDVAVLDGDRLQDVGPRSSVLSLRFVRRAVESPEPLPLSTPLSVQRTVQVCARPARAAR